MAKLWDDTNTYNVAGRSSGPTFVSGDNFITKKLKSAENAIGTTLALPAVLVHNMETNRYIDNLQKDQKREWDELYQKYGFKSRDDYFEQLDKTYDENDNETEATKQLLDIPGLNDEERALAAKHTQAWDQHNRELKDWSENNYASKKVGQDRGKFLGSAINTLSTGFDIASMAAGIPNGPGVNAVQGAIEGVADELEQNGLENFDWGRAGQNAAAGAAAGAATGALNNAVNARLVSNGGNIINGRNFVTKGLNSALKSGVGRGALSGAVGGGVGAATGSALSGQDIGTGIANTLQGAKQGAIQGGIAGGTMSLANRAFNRFAPSAAQAMQENAARNASYGDTLRDQFKGAYNSGDSVVAENMLKPIVNGTQNVGADLVTLANRGNINNASNINSSDNTLIDEADAILNKYNTLDGEIPTEAGSYGKYVSQRSNAIQDLRNNFSDSDLAFLFTKANDPKTRALIFDSIGSPEIRNRLADYSDTAVSSILEERAANTGSSTLSESPETELYRTVTGETEVPRTTDTDLMYGESELGNRTRRGMLADSLERFGNTLEGAQTNVTRAAAKDLGIESTGKVVENVRKKTGLTNLETQAAFAKELTGDVNSLMDRIQKNALTASEDGKGYEVNTDSVSNKVETIVDEEIPLSLFGSQNARNKFIGNLRRDITSYDSDILTKANKFKAVAADLRGKGVVEPAALDKAKSKVYTKIANELDDLSYKAIPQDNVDAMFDATINEMRGRANQAEANGNKDIAKAYNQAANKLDAEPRTIKAFRSFKKDFVDVSKINELTQRAENGAAVQMGRSFGGSLKRFGNSLLQRPVNATLAKAGGVVNEVADNIANRTSATTGTETPAPTPATTVSEGETVSTTSTPATQLYNIIGRAEGEKQGDAAARGYLEQAAKGTGTVAINNNPSASTALYNTVTNGNATTANSGSSVASMTSGDYYVNLLERALNMALEANDAPAFGALLGMYQDAVSAQNSSSTEQVKLTDKQRQANAAERALNDFETAEHNFAYDVSDIPVLGNIANLGGNEYASKAEALALQIGYMLSGATVNAQEAKNIGMAYVPQPRDNEVVRNSKLAQIRGIISDYQKTYAE